MYDRHPAKKLLLGTLAAKDCSSTGDFAYNEHLDENTRVWRLKAKVTTVMVSTGTIVITFYVRPTYGSTSGQITLGTVVIPATAAANNEYYKDITPVNVAEGSQIIANVTTAATTSGACIAHWLDDVDPEVALNQALIASA